MTSTEHKNVGYYLSQICTCKPKNLISLGLLLLLFYYLAGSTSERRHDTHFDYLVFTQRWIPTACIQYVEKPSPYSRRCTLPKQYKMWAIHGLWPTQNNNMGPFFCNKSLPFNITQLQPIMYDLMAYWPNIEGDKDTTSLWVHEWEKHGTCAAQLDSLNTEFKYFSKTLAFYKKYKFENLLARMNIVPSDSAGYYVSDLFNILQSSFGKTPQIHCIFETHTHQPFLFEVRMCFNKDLELINCSNDLTNCPRDRVIIYPDTSTPPNLNKQYTENAEKDFRLQLFHIFQVAKFVQWMLL